VPQGETAVNRRGNHSIHSGALGLKVFDPRTPTADRLQSAVLRVQGMLLPVAWDDALASVAEVWHAITRYGEAAWGVDCYSSQFWENTDAITKLALGAVKTLAFAEHDKPTASNDATGVDDAGVDGSSASGARGTGTREVGRQSETQ
jgi:arsenite oxidase large subunit